VINIKKPWGITLNVVMFAIAGITAFLASIGILTDSSIVTELFPITVFIAPIAVLTLVLSVFYLIFAIYLWQLDTIAWWGVLIFNLIGITMGVLSLVLTPAGWIVIALQLFMIASLFHKDTISAVNPEGLDYPGWELE